MHTASLFLAVGSIFVVACSGSAPSEDTAPGGASASAALTEQNGGASCGGNLLTKASALTRFEPGATEARIGHWRLTDRRTRTCNDLTGCGAWSANDGGRFRAGGYAGPERRIVPLATEGDVSLRIDSFQGNAVVELELRAAVVSDPMSVEHLSGTATYDYVIDGPSNFRGFQVGYDSQAESPVSGGMKLDGWAFDGANFFQDPNESSQVREHCARFVAHGRVGNGHGGETQYEATIEATY